MEREKEEKESKSEEHESGYSERQMDIDAEIRAGEWQNLKKFKTYRQRSRQWKIIATYQAVNNRLNQLVKMYYEILRDNPRGGEKLLQDLRKLRLMQEFLLQCMVWEPKGQLKKDMVPKEIWELIE
ncbi:MAG: hypothetical protein HY426_02895 [Candidatus Levybacteria bacterium]|nr:hypothetical protein [Candidatus Levybacteria bacterium]